MNLRALLLGIAVASLAACREKVPDGPTNLATTHMKFPDESSARTFSAAIDDAVLSADLSKRFSQLHGRDIKITISHTQHDSITSINVGLTNVYAEEADQIGKAVKEELEMARAKTTPGSSRPSY